MTPPSLSSETRKKVPELCTSALLTPPGRARRLPRDKVFALGEDAEPNAEDGRNDDHKDDDGSDDEPDCGRGETSCDRSTSNRITRLRNWFFIERWKNPPRRESVIRTKATIADARRICINFGAWGVPIACALREARSKSQAVAFWTTWRTVIISGVVRVCARQRFEGGLIDASCARGSRCCGRWLAPITGT